MTKIREDSKSLWLQAGGYIARPGDVSGYSHCYDMSAGNLKKGDIVKAHHCAGSPITKITTANGQILHWHHDYESPHLLPEYARPKTI